MRGSTLPAILLALTASVSACSAQANPVGSDGIGEWRSGRYASAIRSLESAAASPSAPWQLRRAHVHLLLETTRFDEAAEAASAYAASRAADSALVADVAASRGSLQEAERAYQAAIRAQSPDSARILAKLGEVLARQGRWDEAHATDERAIGAGAVSEDADALIAVAAAYVRGGRRDPRMFRDALAVLDHAATTSSGHPGVHVALAELFLLKYNAPDAREAAGEALAINSRHPGALLVEARRRRFEQETGADSLIGLALEVAPASVRAHALAALLELDAEDAMGATREAELALSIDPSDAEALAAAAAARLLVGDEAGVSEVESRAAQYESASGYFYAVLAEQAARLRRYSRAAELAVKGSRLDPREWRAHALAGINLLRTGDVDSARAALERAFAGDPYDPWTKNTLDLLDSYDRFEERREGRFVLLLEREEADLLAPYIHDMLASAFDSLSRRYQYEPSGAIRLELYRRHADFSVRTVGLAGLGALGVSFGDVLAMDSPAARRPGEFNYGSTAWHELAHTFTLGLSGGMIPRWLSEGISVYEEKRARPGWGSRPGPAMLVAYATGALPPPSRLGDAFANPGTGARLAQAYVLASLVAEHLVEVKGEAALSSFVRSFADGIAQEEAMQAALGMSPSELDASFDRWMHARYPQLLGGDSESALARLVSWREEGVRLMDAGRPRDALAPLQRASAMIPDYGGADSPRLLIARAHLMLGDTLAAIGALDEHTSLAETDMEANLLLAELHESRGVPGAVMAVAPLERALWMTPYDPDLHERLASVAHAAGDHSRAVRERRAILALGPPDRAGAHYALAVALRNAGDRSAARSEVLRSLEIAPNFAEAQDLLLELREARTTPEDHQ